MGIPKFLIDAKGTWAGTSKLNLPWLEPDLRVTESQSTLTIELDRNETFATVTYTWLHEGQQQDGKLIVCQDKKETEVQMGWVDSWHENEAVLYLKGSGASSNAVKATGSYGEGDEAWGWSIALSLEGDSFRMKMENLPPNEEPMWAVDAEYRRLG